MITLTQNSSILIIGAGEATRISQSWILTPYHLPSPISAGNDINKISELSSSAPRGSAELIVPDQLAHEAINGWREDPVFQGLFHETGAVCAASSPEGQLALDEGDGYSSINGWTRLENKDDFQHTMPPGVLTGSFPLWKGWWRRDGCGWVEASKGIENAVAAAKKLGVTFICGERGKVESLIYENGDVKGAVVAYGKPFRADRVVLCAGANAARLLDMKDQLRPTAWTLAHIRMTEEETQLYKNLPVLFNIERGFFIEPDTEKHDLKICDEHPGYCNWEASPENDKKSFLPFAYHQIPKDAEERIRQFLQETMPQLADRPFSFARICWCADTPDRAFLISRHPEYVSLTLGVGGSGHGYSYIPAIGGIIADCLECKMSPEMQHRFRWRPDTAVERDWTDLQSRFGPPNGNHIMDFQDVKEWTNIQNNVQ